MLATVVLMLVYLTPAIVSLGRELDFAFHLGPAAPPRMSALLGAARPRRWR